MKEDFLHYLWQYQYFDKQALKTDNGDALQIFHPGHPHTNAGPDFGHARLKLGDIAWVGQVEIHINASDWYRHGHQGDPLYESVVLHVVWENDREVLRQDGSAIPCFTLKDRVSPELRQRYEALQGKSANSALPCQPWLGNLSPIIKFAALDRALLHRLERRADEWLLLLRKHRGDWSQVAYLQLAHYLGGIVNAQPFVQLANQVSWATLRREHSQPEQLAARLFGYAGFLKDPPADGYQESLQKIFHWQQAGEAEPPVYPAWKWSRMRPSSFPTLRLAQLVAIAHAHPNLLEVVYSEDLTEVEAWLQVPRPAYWQEHYHFGKRSKKKRDSWPTVMLAINWFAPLCYAYGKYQGKEEYQEKAVSILQQLPAEKNRLLQTYLQSGFHFNTAADTQGALELREYSCKPRKCLSCPIGVKALSCLPTLT